MSKLTVLLIFASQALLMGSDADGATRLRFSRRTAETRVACLTASSSELPESLLFPA